MKLLETQGYLFELTKAFTVPNEIGCGLGEFHFSHFSFIVHGMGGRIREYPFFESPI